MANALDIISKFQDAIVQKSQSLLRLTKSSDFFDTANDMETSELKPSNMRAGYNEIASSNSRKIVKLVKKYVTKLNGNSSRCLDNIYGVYKRGNLLMIGNSPIKFEGDFVQVNERNYRLSVGLLQLLFKKHPNGNLINSDDFDNYRMIIEDSSAHKKHYCANESIRKLKSKKFYNFIAPMFEKLFVKSDSSLSREDHVYEVENAREKRKMVEQTNGVAAKKILEPIVNPLTKKLVDPRIDSDLLTTNETDSYYEGDHSSEDASDYSTNEYPAKSSPNEKKYNVMNWRHQRESKKRQWTSDDEEEEVVPKISRADITTAYELEVWDDPNKLVDRLRVLIADQNMGIRTNYGEIHFILSELRNAGIIN